MEKDIDWSKFDKYGNYNGKPFSDGYKIRYNLMLNDVYNQIDCGINIAKKYNVTAGHISQIKKKFSQLKYKPLIKDGKLKCHLCDNQESLTFHHNHETGEFISILCRVCNRKVGGNELEYSDKTKREYEKTPRGRPEGKNFEFIKSIKLNQKQLDNWDPKKIKAFLDGSLKPIESNNSDVMDKFKRLYQIMNLYLIGKLTPEKISEIPNSILIEIEQIEEEFNFD